MPLPKRFRRHKTGYLDLLTLTTYDDEANTQEITRCIQNMRMMVHWAHSFPALMVFGGSFMTRPSSPTSSPRVMDPRVFTSEPFREGSVGGAGALPAVVHEALGVVARGYAA